MFDSRKRTSWRQADLDRARFWYGVRLYCKVLLIVGIPWVLVLWAMLNWL